MSSSSSSSSSNPKDELDLSVTIMAQQAALLNVYANNNLFMAYYLNQQDNKQQIHRGSNPGHRVIHCGRANDERNLWADYFTENPRYPDSMFRRRFRMGQILFLRIVNVVEGHDNYFVQRYDAFGRLGLSSLQKITAVFRMLAYGAPTYSTDEYVKIGESTTIESMKRFCQAVVELFGERYLRSPNANDVASLIQICEKRGFPRMLGSVDCMHRTWKNCPTAWVGQYNGRSGSPTIILEAVAHYDLWI